MRAKLTGLLPEYEKKIRDLIDEGLTGPRIAKEMGVCYGTILNHLKRLGIKPKRTKIRTKGFKESKAMRVVVAVIKNPETLHTQLAREAGCSREFVGQVSAWARVNGLIPSKEVQP